MVSMPVSVIVLIGVLAQVDEPDVGQVERLVVAGVEARPLGAERVVLRAQRLGRLGVLDDRADLVAQDLGDDVVGRLVRDLVGEHAEDARTARRSA